MNNNINKFIFYDLFLKIHILIFFGKMFHISDSVCIKVFRLWKFEQLYINDTYICTLSF